MHLLIAAVNSGVRFLLELCGLAAVGHWAWQWGQAFPTKALFSVGAVILLALVWALFRADAGAVVRVGTPIRILLEVGAFAGATAALCATGRVWLGCGFAVVAVINEVLDHTL